MVQCKHSRTLGSYQAMMTSLLSRFQLLSLFPFWNTHVCLSNGCSYFVERKKCGPFNFSISEKLWLTFNPCTFSLSLTKDLWFNVQIVLKSVLRTIQFEFSPLNFIAATVQMWPNTTKGTWRLLLRKLRFVWINEFK